MFTSPLLTASTAYQGKIQIPTELGLVSASLDADIQTHMSSGHIPSLQCGIVIQDRLVLAKGYGEQPELNTVYMIGSITKTFTATAFLQLMEQGLIDLDADINTYLSFSVRNPDYPATPVTIRQLLSHTSGLAREFGYMLFDNGLIEWLNDQFDLSLALWDSPPTLDELITSTSMSNTSIWESQPGTAFSYSNLGFMVLSYIFEEVSGQSLAAYVQEHIATPLGMSSTGFAAADFPGQLAIGHERVNITTIAALPHYDTYYFGAGQLRSTVLDLAPYMIAHMNLGRYGPVQLLQPSSVEIMHQPVTPGYGLGWITQNDVEGHSGGVWGFLSEMYFQETARGSFGFILLVNRAVVITQDSIFISNYATICELLCEEAERLFEQALTNAGLTTMLVISGLSVGVAVTITIVVIFWRRRPRKEKT